jgi:hypothetical protein
MTEGTTESRMMITAKHIDARRGVICPPHARGHGMA